MDKIISYNTDFQDKLIKAINLVSNDSSNANKKFLIDLFKVDFDDNKATIYEMFSNNKLTLAQQEILFDSIEVKQKCNLYNTISVEARPFVI